MKYSHLRQLLKRHLWQQMNFLLSQKNIPTRTSFIFYYSSNYLFHEYHWNNVYLIFNFCFRSIKLQNIVLFSGNMHYLHIDRWIKLYYHTLLHRAELLSKEISQKFSIYNTLITTFGLHYNEYSGIFTNVITLDDLFA